MTHQFKLKGLTYTDRMTQVQQSGHIADIKIYSLDTDGHAQLTCNNILMCQSRMSYISGY